MLKFLKALFVILHLSYYALMTFSMVLFVILLYMLMIPLSILSVIRLLICGSNLNWLLNLNLIYETLDRGRKWFVNFNAGKTWLVAFDLSDSAIAIDVKTDGSVLEEKSSIGMPGLYFSSNWIPKTASNKIEALIHSLKFFSPEVALSGLAFLAATGKC